MIEVEYIIADKKSLLTIMFNNAVMKHMKTKWDDSLNFYQASHNMNCLTLFKADTGYRITRVPRRKKTYQITVKHSLKGIKEFDSVECTYYLKRNGFVRILLKT